MADDTKTSALTADPGPLGLAGFAATTLVLSVTNAGLVDASVALAVLPLALFYGGLAQFMAGMWEFRNGNTFGATAFPTYGAFWMAFAFYAWFFQDKIPAQFVGQATGMFLLVFALVTLYLSIAAMRTSGAILIVFVALTLTFVFLCIGSFAGSKGISHIGGWIGIITAILAFYTSFAVVTNATWKRTVLPVFPLTPKDPSLPSGV
jgi:succinate-acetate transporter protein